MSDSSGQTKKHVLSHQFLVACAVYEITEIDNEKAYFPSIVDKLSDIIPEEKVREGLEFMWNWRIVMRQLEYLDDTHENMRWYHYITSSDYKNIKDIYDRFYDSSSTTKIGDKEDE